MITKWFRRGSSLMPPERLDVDVSTRFDEWREKLRYQGAGRVVGVVEIR